MSKKAYRPVPSSTPRYPRLVDLDRRSVLNWGLVAVGSLWLGSAGCKRGSKVLDPLEGQAGPGVPPVNRLEKGELGHDAGSLASKEDPVDAQLPKPADPDVLRPPGAPPLFRREHHKGAKDEQAPKRAGPDAGTAPVPPGGQPPAARLEPGQEDVKLGGRARAPRMYDAKSAAAKDRPAGVDVPTPGRAKPSRLEDANQPKKKAKAKKAAKPKE